MNFSALLLSEFHILLICTLTVDAAFGSDLDYTVRCGLEYLMIVGRKKHHALEIYE